MNDVFSGRLAILGLGYIGLPTAVALATRGIEVIGVDVKPDIVAAVSRGEVPFVEPDLAVGVSGAVAMGRLTATTQTPEADAFIKNCRETHGLIISGLMCIPPVDEAPAPHFALTAKIAARNGLTKLSMGMSADFATAIQFGATHVRVGSAIFGHR